MSIQLSPLIFRLPSWTFFALSGVYRFFLPSAINLHFFFGVFLHFIIGADIGKTHICRKLFQEYVDKKAKDENIPFCHIGYIEYDGDMGSSLQNCLKYKQQEDPRSNKEAAWRELEYLASGGKLLLFVDNVNIPMGQDPGLERLRSIPGAVVLTSRMASFSREFEPYRLGFLSVDQCKKIYAQIRYDGSRNEVGAEEIADLEYIIEQLAARHTLTIENLAHLARTKLWSVKRLRDELEEKGFRLEYRDENSDLVNIQKSYETLYDLSDLTDIEQNILQVFSVLPNIPFSAKVCTEWLLLDARISEEDSTLMGLYQKGWLQFDFEEDCFCMHPVFAQFIFERHKRKWKQHRRLIEKCEESSALFSRSFTLENTKLFPLEENTIEELNIDIGIEQNFFPVETALWLVFRDGNEKVKEFYRKYIEYIDFCEKGNEENSFDSKYYFLAEIYTELAEYKRAEELYRKFLQVWKNNLRPDNASMAIYFYEIAEIYKKQRDYVNTLVYYIKAYKVFLQKFGLSNLYTQIIVINMKKAYTEFYNKDDFDQWLEEQMKE